MSWVLLSKTTIDSSWTRGRRKAEFKILELKSNDYVECVANSTNQMLASWHSRISSALQRMVWRMPVSQIMSQLSQQTKQGIAKLPKDGADLLFVNYRSYNWDRSSSLIQGSEWFVYLYCNLYNQECACSSWYRVSSLVFPGRIVSNSGLEERILAISFFIHLIGVNISQNCMQGLSDFHIGKIRTGINGNFD